MTARIVAVMAVLAVGCGPGRVAGPSAPRFPVPAEVGRLVVDDQAFAGFATRVRSDIEASLRDRTMTDAERRDRHFVWAVLEALDGRWPEAVAAIDAAAALEPDPDRRIMTGLSIRVWAEALSAPGDPRDRFRAVLVRRVEGLPPSVNDQLSELRAMGQVFTPEVCRQLVDQAVGPTVLDGTVDFAGAQTIVFQRYAAVRLAPVGAVIDEVLGERGIPVPE